MNSISSLEISSWERFYRANFVNSLTGFKSVNLIGTVNSKGQPNLAIFSSLVHLGSDPALIGYINRPIEAAPHTLANIESTGIYTVNHIDPSFVNKAHQSSAKYEEGTNEFEEVGLSMEFKDNFIAPFVKESKIKYALELKEIIPIKLNNTFLVIGEILNIYLTQNIVSKDGFINLDHAEIICSNGIDAYYKTQFIDRYKYAKPGIPLEKLKSL